MEQERRNGETAGRPSPVHQRGYSVDADARHGQRLKEDSSNIFTRITTGILRRSTSNQMINGAENTRYMGGDNINGDAATRYLLPTANLIVPPLPFSSYPAVSAANTGVLRTHQTAAV